MSDWTAEKIAQRAVDLGLVELREMDSVWAAVGSREVESEVLAQQLLGKGLLTNLQLDRLMRGERTGFFFGKYMVKYLIGTGTFARVYRATHRDSGDVVAVKVLRKRYRENMAELEQFLREGRMGSQLRHPNVVPIYEIDGDPRNPYMVLEFVEGQNLRELVKVRKKFEHEAALPLIGDIAAGLAYAAEKGITHRDLKMSNVLITSTGRAKLVDFGLAAASDLDNEEKLADCPNARAIDYAALERGTGVRKDDIRSDVYFTGCIMYNMLSGQPPLTETRDRLQRLNFTRFRDILPLSELEPDIPVQVLAFVNRAMDLDPSKRFANPAEMVRELKNVVRKLKEAAENPGAAEDDPSENGNGSSAESEKVKVDREGEDRSVMIVASNAQVQDALRDKLKKRGYRVLITSNPERVFDRFEDDAEVADVVVFSTTELGEDAVEAFNRFGTEKTTNEVPAVLLVDQRERELIALAKRAPHRVLLPLPLKVRNLRAALLKLLSARAKS